MVLRGNVRELEIDMRRVVALAESGELIAVRHLPPEITKQNGDATLFPARGPSTSCPSTSLGAPR
jgi:transcriptional regulator with PAS, ATPase and Fis domain